MWQDEERGDTNAQLLSRGVWGVPWRGLQGERFVVAVDHTGRCIFQARVFKSDETAGVSTMLWRMLDREDPRG